MSTLNPEMSLWNLNNYSLQDIFDKVADHLLTQNKKSKDYLKINNNVKPILSCVYKSILDDNTILKCAIGCLIPADKYNDNFEGKAIASLIYYLNLEIETNRKDLLIRLQVIHDIRSVKDWWASLEDVANIFGLSINNAKIGVNNHG